MSRILFLAAAGVLLVTAAQAQSGALTGRVVDDASDATLPGATVAVWRVSATDSTLVTGASADLDGAVRVDAVPSGRYDVVTSFVGYDPVRQAVTVGTSAVDLGTIRLAATAEALGEVHVAAERPQVQAQIDRTVYNTADDPVAQGGTATDVLAALPSVDVDVDGNVSLRGAGNVAVFINGRPAPVSGAFLAAYLQSLPAGSVERVEIIPNPSAAFEPDGVGGVINIVLTQDAETGLGGSVTLGTDTQGGYDATSSLTVGRGPWSLAATYGYRNDARSGGGTSFRINRYETSPTTLDQREVQDRTRTSNLLNLSAGYALSRATSFTSQVQVGTRGSDETELNTTLRASESGDPIAKIERRADEVDDGRSLDTRLGLRHRFGEDHTLVVEGRGEVSDETEEQRTTDLLVSGTNDLDAPQRIDQEEREREMALQADYTRPVAGGRIDAGYKGEWARERNALNVERQDAATGAFVSDPDESNRFDFDQTVHAVYVQGAREWGIVGLQGGLRYERAQTTFRLLTTPQAFPNRYASLFPSAFLSVQPTEALTFKASYSRRINRPSTRALNPFPSFDDPLNIRQGNPALRPEYVDAFEVSATRLAGWGSVALTPYARRTTDIIRRLSSLRDDGVRVRTFANLDASTSYGVELVTSVDEVGGLSGYVSLEGFRVLTEGATDAEALSNDAFGWGGRVNATYHLGDRFGWGALDFQATARYSAPLATEQGRVGARTSLDLALRQTLFGERASLTLRARDPFGWEGFQYTLDQPTLFQTFERNWGTQQIGLTFSYAFGRQEASRERRGRPERDGDAGGGEDY